MGWPATDRYELPRAPGGLGFVQDVLNTRPTLHLRRPHLSESDLLDDLESAQRWLDGALENWSVESGVPQNAVTLSEDDLDKLRALRADLNAVIGRGDQAHGAALFPSASVAARMGSDGGVLLEPRGEGARRVASIVLIEAFTAQRLDTWRRLKACRNDRCGVAFYDRSRPNSGVWHDASVCGNAVNLRASRARKRQGQLGVAQQARLANETDANS